MSRITRESFIDQFQSAGGLDAAAVAADASAALEKAGIGTADLHALAGADGKIDTHAELGRLFDLLDRVDHDGHYRSIETRTSGSNAPTVSGDAYDALAKDLATARSKAPTQPSSGPVSRPEQMPSSATISASNSAISAHGFTDVHLSPLKYRNQGDSRWANHPYPTSSPQTEIRSLHDSGCAPCALAMVDSALRGVPTRPEVTADFAVQNGFSGRPGVAGSDTNGLVRAWATGRGFSLTVANSTNQTTNADRLVAGIREGGVALVSVGTDPVQRLGHFTARNHVIAINGVAMKDGEEWLAVADPGRRNQDDGRPGKLGVDDEVVRLSGADNGCGQVWISRKQLEKEMHRCFILEKGQQS